MNQSTYFSIIIPAYNREKYIAKAINSILEQTFTDWELIVVNDASTDGTKNILNRFASNPKIKVLDNSTNLERSASRNKGIDIAQGKYICFLDSDDYHLPNHLQVLHNAIQREQEPEALFFTNAWDEDANGRRERTCPDLEDYNLFHYILTYTFNPQRTAIHHSILKEFQFDKNIPGVEDLDIFLRIATKYKVIQVKERTTVYVMHEGAYTMSADKPAKELRNFKYIFNKSELKPFLPKKSTNRLLSMCHFHLARIADENKNSFNAIKHAILSFFLFPKGYNGKTNKIILVVILYNIPTFGRIIRKLKAIS